MVIRDRTYLHAASNRLIKLRERLNFSAREMRERLGVTRSAYWKYEAGEGFPGFNSIKLLSDQFGVSMDWLMFEKGPMFFKEKEKKAELEELKRENTRLLEKVEEVEKRRDEEKMKPELAELFRHMENIPVLRYELLTDFHKFKLANEQLVQKAMAPGEKMED